MIIFSIVEQIPFINQKWYIQWPVTIIIAFLAGAYLTPSDVYATLASYTGMGLLLGGIVPFMVIFYFTMRIAKTEPEYGRLISTVIWLAFIAFIAYKLISGIGAGLIDSAEGLIYLIMLALAVVLIVFYGKISDYVFKKGVTAGLSEAERNRVAALEGKINNLKEQRDAIQGSDAVAISKRKSLDKQIANLRDAISDRGY